MKQNDLIAPEFLTISKIDNISNLLSMELEEKMKIVDERNLLHLDLAGLSIILVFKVLLPVFTAATGGIIAGKITRDYYRGKNAHALKEELHSLAGKKIIELDDNKKEECILFVNEVLEPFDITREQAREVVDYLLRSIKSNGGITTQQASENTVRIDK
jgi:hypothetical protein